MFDLDFIENNWKQLSLKLSDEDVINIFKSDGATYTQYENEMQEYKKNTSLMSAEDRLLYSLFGTNNELIEKENKLREKYKEPEMKKLSPSNQKRVVEGCLDVVFDETKKWYNYFEKNVDIEKIYYVCLETLISTAKNCTLAESVPFRHYVFKCIERSIINLISKLEHIHYRDAWCIINNDGYKIDNVDYFKQVKMEFKYNYHDLEMEKPSKIYDRLKNEYYDVDYLKDYSSEEFINIYNQALDEMDDLSKNVMRLIFDSNGNSILTYNEISDFLGINPNKVYRIKRKVLKKLKQDERILDYK